MRYLTFAPTRKLAFRACLKAFSGYFIGMEDTVTISVQEYEATQKLVGELQATVVDLKNQLEWCKRQIFGQKSERLIDLPGNVPELPDFEMPKPDEPVPETVEVPKHSRKKKKGKGKYTVEIPDDLERVEVPVDVPEPERTLPDGTLLTKIGEDRSEKLAFRPGEYYMKVFVRPKYADPNDSKLGVVQESMPASIIERSKFDVSFIAHVIVEKFAFHMPLYRIVEKLQGRDIRLTRQTLSQLIRETGLAILPLFRLMVERTLAQGVIFTDDTPVKLQARGKCREARIWAYIGGLPNAPPYHIYQFTTDRSYRHPTKFLDDFEGVLHADAFGAYEKLHEDESNDIAWAACWAHARRYFEKALTGAKSDTALWVMQRMRYLFMYERVAWAGIDTEEETAAQRRLRIRDERERPIVDAIFQRFVEEVKSTSLLPQSKLAKAIGYMQCREESFRLYLSNPDLRMDNNTAERALRKLTIGRKNWMFIGSEKAGEAMAALLSFTQTCRAMGINPQEYLEYIFSCILDYPPDRLEELLPDQWKRRKDEGKETAQSK
jgi:transposase